MNITGGVLLIFYGMTTKEKTSMLSFRGRRKSPEPGNDEKLFTMLYGKYYGLVKNTASLLNLLEPQVEKQKLIQWLVRI